MKVLLKTDDGVRWTSPEIQCEPFRYYRLTFRSKVENNTGCYAVFFYDADGKELAADNYGSICKSVRWKNHSLIYRGRENAVKASIVFISGNLKIDSVKVEQIDRDTACRWADTLYRSIPAVHYNPPPDRWKFIPGTMDGLKRGKVTRWVMLGDSIVNDTNNSNFEVLVKRIYPKADIQIIPSVRGGTGCQYYEQPEHFREYVSDKKPDLLFIGGISHGGNIDVIRNVINMTREHLSCEIILMSGPVWKDWREYDEHNPDIPLPEMEYPADHPQIKFGLSLAGLAKEINVEYIDMATVWNKYLAVSKKPHHWFHRDICHANDRGKQVLARILEIYFSPQKKIKFGHKKQW